MIKKKIYIYIYEGGECQRKTKGVLDNEYKREREKVIIKSDQKRGRRKTGDRTIEFALYFIVHWSL